MRCLSSQDNGLYARDNIDREDKDEIVKRIGEIADGVFQFSDIHEHGGDLSGCSVDLITRSSLQDSYSAGRT